LQARRKIRRVEHYAALPYSEIAAFVSDLRHREGIAARAMEFLILTAGRTSEVLRARWDEFNLHERVWVVPSDRMKSGKEHRVPLSSAVITLLEQMAAGRVSDFVFHGTGDGKPLFSLTLLKFLGRI
jgi:integrase